jgi:hypothetical protein
MRLFAPRTRPEPWSQERQKTRRIWSVPFIAVDWVFDWVAYFLSNWKFLEVLEYLGSLSVLIAVIFYFWESPDRVKQMHYQAWQVINTAQGKGGSGGRIDALQELNADQVPLVGVDVSGAFLQGIHLQKARLLRSNFNAADLRECDFRFADFTDSDLRNANFRSGNLSGANLHGADLSDADLTDADLRNADLSSVKLDNADLHRSNLQDILWREISSIKNANLEDVKNPPAGFLDWAVQNGAVESADSAPGSP